MTEEERKRKSAERKMRWRGVMYGGGTPPAAHSGTPEWVPANAKIFIDLVNVRAWTQADGEVAVDTLLGSDPNTENAWGSSLYDEAKLTENGYVTDGNNAPAFIGATLDFILAGATVVVKTKRTGGISEFTPLVAMSTDGNDAIELDLSTDATAALSSYSGPLNSSISAIVNQGAGSINCAAITLTADRCDIAVNGSSAVAGSLESADRPAGNPFTAVLTDPSAQNAIQYITVYDALPDTTGLSALGQTGVANTAPTGIAATEWDGGPSTGDFTGTMSQADVGATLGSLGQIGSVHLVASDAEGNPTVFTLRSFTCANPSLEMKLDDPASPHPVVSVYNPTGGDEEITLGDYTFTVRATDPGGLYVEQGFTLTVTA